MAHINSRYTVVKVLGKNTAGSVFLVKDSLYNNKLIALKTIQPSHVDGALLKNLREEFFTLSQCKHPNIAQVFDFGKIHSTDLVRYQDNFFFTLEYIEGKDLFQFTETLEWETLAEIVFQIAHALAYIHRHGLIHFDIKPANIIITHDVLNDENIPLVKIIDFGFASSHIESLDQPIRGSLEYLAPELLRGDHYDRRVDLYSLGVTLFEIIARHTPFHGTSATETIKNHLSSLIPSVTAVREHTPPLFEELITSLLQKNPAMRFRSATDIVKHLHLKFSRELLYSNVLANIPVHRLIGREKEIQLLQNFLMQGLGFTTSEQHHRTQAICITGEAGIGKTPLLNEVKRRAQIDGILFFKTQCFAQSSQPYEPFRKILREQIAFVKSLGTKGETFLHLHNEFLTAVWGDDATQQINHIAQLIDKPEIRLHFVDMWSKLFCEISLLAPFAVWIDNIENADESTLELLHYMLRNSLDFSIAFLLTGESESNVVPLLKAYHDIPLDLLVIAPLDEHGIQELLTASLDLDIDQISLSLVKKINEHIGGSPYIIKEFIAQYANIHPDEILSAIEEDLDRPNASGKFADTISHLYQQKISQFKPEEYFLLRLLSCFRAPASINLLERLSPFSAVRLKSFLFFFVNIGIVRSREHGSRYFLAQSQFQHFLYHSLGEEKQMLHALIAEAIVHDGAAANDEAEIIAYHFKYAGKNKDAFTYFLRAAERKRSLYALHETITLLREACALLPAEEIENTVFENLAECYSLAGDYKNAVQLYEQLRSGSHEDIQRYRYAKELALIYNREGRLEEAIALLLEASTFAQTVEEKIDIEEELIIIDISRGRYTEAFERSQHALQVHSDLSNSVTMTAVLNNLGIIHFYQNKYDDAAACFQRSITILQREQQKSKLIAPYLNLGNVCSAQEQFSDAAQHWQRALFLSQEVGNLQQEARAYNNIGIASYNQGKYEDASRYYEKAYEIFSRLGTLPGMALCLTNMGEVFLANAEYEKAIDCWEKDLRLYNSLQDEHGMIEVNLQLAGVHIALGSANAIQPFLESAAALLSRSGIATQHALFNYVVGCRLVAENNSLQAKEHLEKARELFATAKDFRSYSLASLKLAETELALSNHQSSYKILDEILKLSTEKNYAFIKSETLLLLGSVSSHGIIFRLQPPILYYIDAFEIIETQIVTETTWRVCYHLGNEFFNRGLFEKGLLHFQYAKQSLEYIASKIKNDALRVKFFNSYQRGEILKEIHSIIEKIETP